MGALSQIKDAGFDVVIMNDGGLAVAPASKLTPVWREFVKSNKPEIFNQLSGAQLLQDIRERVEERAAIMEFDGGLSRKDAEQAAAAAIRVYCYRVTDKPSSELSVIMPNTELPEAIEILNDKYGDRLIEVYASPYCMAVNQPSPTI